MTIRPTGMNKGVNGCKDKSRKSGTRGVSVSWGVKSQGKLEKKNMSFSRLNLG